MPALLEACAITKRFPGVTALREVSFDLQPGEIHALCGENGAGKSTLIKLLSGLHPHGSYEGELRLDGRPAAFRTIADAQRHGIAVIYQELALVPELSIAENLFLGCEPRRGALIDWEKLYTDARGVLASVGLDLSAETPVGRLGVGQQQLVEIAKALGKQTRILILDEPTAALAEREVDTLLELLRGLRAHGIACIYISHKLDEVFAVADRITVLRDGRSIGTQNAADLDMRQLITWMVGRELKEHYPRPPHQPGEVALSVRGLHAPGVHGVSFDLHCGEVLGLAGLVGAGRSELARVLAGVVAAKSGEIAVAGHPVKLDCPAAARAAGIALVPEDRKRDGLVMTQTVGFNLALPWTRLWAPGWMPDFPRRDAIVGRAMTDFSIKASGPDVAIGTLSGGNQQKVVVGKWMEKPPRILILDEPTRGVDVGAREEIFELIGRLVTRRMAVLLISSDLPEVMNLSHRLALYRDGQILRLGQADEFTPEQVMSELTRQPKIS